MLCYNNTFITTGDGMYYYSTLQRIGLALLLIAFIWVITFWATT